MAKRKQRVVRKKDAQERRPGKLAEMLNRSVATTKEVVANYNAAFQAKAAGGTDLVKQFGPQHQS